jgi:hypothetical protein
MLKTETYYICDRCGKKLGQNEKKYYVRVNEFSPTGGSLIEQDICEECFEEFFHKKENKHGCNVNAIWVYCPDKDSLCPYYNSKTTQCDYMDYVEHGICYKDEVK